MSGGARQALARTRLRLPIRLKLAVVSAGLTFAILLLFALVVGAFTEQRLRANFDNDVRATAADLQERLRVQRDLQGEPALAVEPGHHPRRSGRRRLDPGGGPLGARDLRGGPRRQPGPAGGGHQRRGRLPRGGPPPVRRLAGPGQRLQALPQPDRRRRGLRAVRQAQGEPGLHHAPAAPVLRARHPRRHRPGVLGRLRGGPPGDGARSPGSRAPRRRSPARATPAAASPAPPPTTRWPSWPARWRRCWRRWTPPAPRPRRRWSASASSWPTPPTSCARRSPASWPTWRCSSPSWAAWTAPAIPRPRPRSPARRCAPPAGCAAWWATCCCWPGPTRAARAPRRPVDLAAAVRDAAVEAGPLAEGHPLSLDVPEEPGEAMVQGSGDDLHRLALNLIENAFLHTPTGTPVVASVRPEGDQVVLEVADRGPGVPARAPRPRLRALRPLGLRPHGHGRQRPGAGHRARGGRGPRRLGGAARGRGRRRVVHRLPPHPGGAANARAWCCGV